MYVHMYLLLLQALAGRGQQTNTTQNFMLHKKSIKVHVQPWSVGGKGHGDRIA